jgi:hypothetical protein
MQVSHYKDEELWFTVENLLMFQLGPVLSSEPNRSEGEGELKRQATPDSSDSFYGCGGG